MTSNRAVKIRVATMAVTVSLVKPFLFCMVILLLMVKVAVIASNALFWVFLSYMCQLSALWRAWLNSFVILRVIEIQFTHRTSVNPVDNRL